MALSLVLGAMSTTVVGQHADIEFGYDSQSSPTGFVVEGDDFTGDGIQYFSQNMDEFLGDWFSDNPGFVTNDQEGLLLNAGDGVWLEFLDASIHSNFGVGFVNYYNPNTDSIESFGRISVVDNAGAGTADLILNAGAIESGDNPQFVGSADSNGDVHRHVTFDLLDDASSGDGAYGFMFRFQSDFDTQDGIMDLSGDPIWVIFNKNMSQSDFENNALPAFGVGAIPEPTSLVLLGLGTGLVLLRRRR